MTQNTQVNIPANTWTQISDGNVTNVTLLNISETDVFVQGTVGAVAPTGGPAGIQYGPGTGEANRPVADLYLGVAGVNRLYAYARCNATVFISNA